MKRRFLTTFCVMCMLVFLLGAGGKKKDASFRNTLDRLQNVGIVHKGIFVANPTFDARTRMDSLRQEIPFQDFFHDRGEGNCPDCVDLPESTPAPEPTEEPTTPQPQPTPSDGGHVRDMISHFDIEESVTEVIEPVHERMDLSTHAATEEESDEDE